MITQKNQPFVLKDEELFKYAQAMWPGKEIGEIFTCKNPGDIRFYFDEDPNKIIQQVIYENVYLANALPYDMLSSDDDYSAWIAKRIGNQTQETEELLKYLKNHIFLCENIFSPHFIIDRNNYKNLSFLCCHNKRFHLFNCIYSYEFNKQQYEAETPIIELFSLKPKTGAMPSIHIYIPSCHKRFFSIIAYNLNHWRWRNFIAAIIAQEETITAYYPKKRSPIIDFMNMNSIISPSIPEKYKALRRHCYSELDALIGFCQIPGVIQIKRTEHERTLLQYIQCQHDELIKTHPEIETRTSYSLLKHVARNIMMSTNFKTEPPDVNYLAGSLGIAELYGDENICFIHGKRFLQDLQREDLVFQYKYKPMATKASILLPQALEYLQNILVDIITPCITKKIDAELTILSYPLPVEYYGEYGNLWTLFLAKTQQQKKYTVFSRWLISHSIDTYANYQGKNATIFEKHLMLFAEAGIISAKSLNKKCINKFSLDDFFWFTYAQRETYLPRSIRGKNPISWRVMPTQTSSITDSCEAFLRDIGKGKGCYPIFINDDSLKAFLHRIKSGSDIDEEFRRKTPGLYSNMKLLSLRTDVKIGEKWKNHILQSTVEFLFPGKPNYFDDFFLPYSQELDWISRKMFTVCFCRDEILMAKRRSSSKTKTVYLKTKNNIYLITFIFSLYFLDCFGNELEIDTNSDQVRILEILKWDMGNSRWEVVSIGMALEVRYHFLYGIHEMARFLIAIAEQEKLVYSESSEIFAIVRFFLEEKGVISLYNEFLEKNSFIMTPLEMYTKLLTFKTNIGSIMGLLQRRAYGAIQRFIFQKVSESHEILVERQPEKIDIHNSYREQYQWLDVPASKIGLTLRPQGLTSDNISNAIMECENLQEIFEYVNSIVSPITIARILLYKEFSDKNLCFIQHILGTINNSWLMQGPKKSRKIDDVSNKMSEEIEKIKEAPIAIEKQLFFQGLMLIFMLSINLKDTNTIINHEEVIFFMGYLAGALLENALSTELELESIITLIFNNDKTSKTQMFDYFILFMVLLIRNQWIFDEKLVGNVPYYESIYKNMSQPLEEIYHIIKVITSQRIKQDSSLTDDDSRYMQETVKELQHIFLYYHSFHPILNTRGLSLETMRERLKIETSLEEVFLYLDEIVPTYRLVEMILNDKENNEENRDFSYNLLDSMNLRIVDISESLAPNLKGDALNEKIREIIAEYANTLPSISRFFYTLKLGVLKSIGVYTPDREGRKINYLAVQLVKIMNILMTYLFGDSNENEDEDSTEYNSKFLVSSLKKLANKTIEQRIEQFDLLTLYMMIFSNIEDNYYYDNYYENMFFLLPNEKNQLPLVTHNDIKYLDSFINFIYENYEVPIGYQTHIKIAKKNLISYLKKQQKPQRD